MDAFMGMRDCLSFCVNVASWHVWYYYQGWHLGFIHIQHGMYFLQLTIFISSNTKGVNQEKGIDQRADKKSGADHVT